MQQRTWRRAVPLCGALLLTLTIVACERSDDPNEKKPVNPGLLQDGSSYTPTDYDKLDVPPLDESRAAAAASSGGNATSAGGGTGEVDAFVRRFLQAVEGFDIDYLLGAFEPNQIKPLRDNASVLYEFGEKITLLQDSVKKKGIDISWPSTDIYVKAVDVEMVDPDHAALTIHVDQIQKALASMAPANGAEGAAPAGMFSMGAGDPGSPGAEQVPQSVPVQLVRRDNTWYIMLPGPIPPPVAEIVVEGLGIANEFLEGFRQKLDEAEADELDQQGLQQLVMQVIGETGAMNKVMALMQKIQQLEQSGVTSEPVEGDLEVAPNP